MNHARSFSLPIRYRQKVVFIGTALSLSTMRFATSIFSAWFRSITLLFLLCGAVNAVEFELASSAPYELKGIFETAGNQSFSLKHTESGQTFWISLGRSVGTLKAISYDAQQRRLTVDSAGKRYELPLAQNDGIPLSVAQSTNSVETPIEVWIPANSNPRIEDAVARNMLANRGSIKPGKMAAQTRAASGGISAPASGSVPGEGQLVEVVDEDSASGLEALTQTHDTPIRLAPGTIQARIRAKGFVSGPPSAYNPRIRDTPTR